MFRQRPLALLAPALVLVTVLALAAGCGSKSSTEGSAEPGGSSTPSASNPSSTPAAPAALDGATIFKTRCAICHGPDGHGDGPTAKALNPKPRNFHDVAYMNSRSDDSLSYVIHNGKGAMPKWGGVLKEEEIAAVLKHIRSLSAKP